LTRVDSGFKSFRPGRFLASERRSPTSLGDKGRGDEPTGRKAG
jgi:hypothetical protein